MNQKLELLKKQKQANPSESENPLKKKRIRIAEKGILLAIPIGFLLLLAILHGDKLLPAKTVSVTKVLAKEVEQGAVSEQTTATDFDLSKADTLFQASGWFEADPYPYRATALVNGVIDEVLVLEGAQVEKGDLLATLIDDDAQLNYQTALAHSQRAEAEYEAQRQKGKFVEAELLTLGKRIETAKARLAELSDNAERKKKLSDGAIAEEQIVQAVLREETQIKTVESLESTREQLTTKLGMENHLSTAAQNRLAIAKTDLARMKLALDRTKIYAPISGIIQALKAEPGQKKAMNSDHPESITVAILFDPKLLQARIDVPLEEASRLFIGQKTRIRTGMLPNKTFLGEVTRIVGESDIQRNTIQAKIRIENPDVRLRPEMLCRAEFLNNQSNGISRSSSSTIALYLPEETVASKNGSTAIVYKLDETRLRVIEQKVTINPVKTDGYYQVIEELKPGDQLVINPSAKLKNNQRIRIIDHES